MQFLQMRVWVALRVGERGAHPVLVVGDRAHGWPLVKASTRVDVNYHIRRLSPS